MDTSPTTDFTMTIAGRAVAGATSYEVLDPADETVAATVGRRLRAGTVWINEVQHLTPLVTFAGHKQSGLGSESGPEGLLEYTAPQTVTVRRTAPPASA